MYVRRKDSDPFVKAIILVLIYVFLVYLLLVWL